MAELRKTMHALVERPSTTPCAVEAVAARGARYARRRRVLYGAGAAAVVAALSATSLMVLRADSADEVVLATEGSTSAGYVAEHPGGYIATGTWQLTIVREGDVIRLSSPSSEHCGEIGIVQPGDEVRGSISGPGSSLRVGERFTCPSQLGERP